MLCNANPRNKKKKTQKLKKNCHKGNSKEAQRPIKPRQIRDIESYQLLDEESQTYFYQKVW